MSSGSVACGTLIPAGGNYKFRLKGDIMNHAIVDRILDGFEGVFKEIKIKYHLTNASIERWRWDLPEIRLLWKAQDAIWRNINVLLDTSRIDQTVGLMEVNAWLDVQKDNRWIRRWQHQIIVKNGGLHPYSAWESYDVVASWNPEKLTSEQPLSEPASTWLDQQRG
jgi:hypothetical protein